MCNLDSNLIKMSNGKMTNWFKLLPVERKQELLTFIKKILESGVLNNIQENTAHDQLICYGLKRIVDMKRLNEFDTLCQKIVYIVDHNDEHKAHQLIDQLF